ncbi:MAG: DUF3784 domain-containing protein [Anaerovoracaceae bacterium]
MWVYLIIGASFILLGLAVHVGKFYFLISGYNTARKKNKANIDVRRLARLIGIYSYINGGLFLLMGVLDAAGVDPPMLPVTIFLILSSVALAVMSQRYDYNVFDERGRLRKGAGKKLIMPGVIMVGTLVFVAVILFFSAQETEVSFLDEGLEIHGIYGDVYRWEEMNNVQLLEELPNIEVRTNGSAVGSKLKGNFRTTEFGAVKLFVDADVPPFIYFERDDTRIIFNYVDAEDTKTTYQQIKAKATK